MLTELRFENFQGFKGKQSIRLAPITLIFGPNSSGKSSIARAVNFLQTLQGEPALKQDSARGSAELNFQSLIYGQNPRNEAESHLKVGLTVSDASHAQKFSRVMRDLRVNVLTHQRTVEYGAILSDEEIEAKLSRHSETMKKAYEVASEITKNLLDSEVSDPERWKAAFIKAKDQNVVLTEAAHRQEIQETLDEFEALRKELQNFGGRDDLVQPITFGFSEAGEVLINSNSFHVLDDALERLSFPDVDSNTTIDGVVWSPTDSEWWFFKNSASVVDLDDEGFRHLDQDSVEARLIEIVNLSNYLANEALNSFRFVDPVRTAPVQVSMGVGAKTIPTATLNRMNDALLALTGQRYSYEVHSVKSLQFSSVQENVVRDHYTGAVLNFEDVGSGLGQVLPILDAAFSESSGCFYIEQPELHLHPRMQSDLMDVLIKEVTDVDSDSKKQFLVETHSESMLLRLQKRIREGSIKSQDVSIIFADIEDETRDGVVVARFNKLREIELDSVGDILDPLPVSFVNLRVEDLL